MPVTILMVEDDEGQQKLYTDAVDDFNVETGCELSISFSETADGAIDKLTCGEYDAVFLDLNLQEDPKHGSQASGNKVLRHIIDNSRLRLVVYVVSGTLHSLAPEFDDLFENPLMRKFERDSDTKPLLMDLVRVLKTGVTEILGGRGRFEQLVNSIFFSHLSKGFNFWIDKDKGCEKELLRYMTLHLLEHLDIPEEDSNRENTYFTPEFYIYPPIKPNVSCGDIVLFNNEKHVVLTPSCDISPRKNGETTLYNVDIVILARVLPLEKEVFDNLNISYSGNNERTNKKWSRFVENHRGTTPKNRFHFLPPYLAIEESVIDFKRLVSLPIEAVVNPDGLERVATVSSPFIRDIQGRFSSYYGRHGQPAGDWSQ